MKTLRRLRELLVLCVLVAVGVVYVSCVVAAGIWSVGKAALK